MTYGWADTILQPLMGVDYYEAAVARNGRDTPQFFRLFMVPGMGHCGGGIGTDRFDAMTALIDWVEKGKAPDSMRAARVVDNREVRSRPLCAYPQVARYSGRGSIDEARVLVVLRVKDRVNQWRAGAGSAGRARGGLLSACYEMCCLLNG